MITLDFSGRHRTPRILQSEAAECGLACLAMVAGHHGYRTDLASLRQKFSISLKGMTLDNLIDIAARMNLSSRPLRLELGDLDKLRLPAVLHWDFNHFVVLTRVKGGIVTIHDPAQGTLKLALSEVSRHFTGIALELAPTTEFQRRSERRQLSLGRLLGSMPGLTGTLVQILLLAMTLQVFAIAGPFFMQLVVDNALVTEDRDLLSVLAIGFVLLAVTQAAVAAVRSWIVVFLGTNVHLQLVSNLFDHLLRLPLTFFEKRHLGDVVSRFESLNVIQRTLTGSFLEALIDGVMAMVTLVMMFIYGLKLSLIVIGAALLYALLRVALYKPFRAASEEQIMRAARQQTNFLETVRGIQSVKLFNRQLQRGALWQNLVVDNANAGIRLQRLSIVYQTLSGILFGAENILVVWIGAHMVLDGGFSVGMLFAFVAYKQQFISRFSSLIEKSIEFRMLGLHTERVGEIALSQPEPRDHSGPGVSKPIKAIRTDIEIRGLDFRYSENDPPVLQSLDLHIAEGESVAIVGPSGCGKTTLAKIMLGLLPPTSGEVLVGGVPLPRIGMGRYREMIGAVMQEDQLFAGSIADNISFFDRDIDQQWIEECATLAAIHDDIAAMPMGFQTLVGDMGTVLSGGQKQRILLARALYRRPKILFLDEATSALDVAREQAVNDAVRRLKLTRVIIAHRPETIAMAERVVRLEGGKIVEDVRVAA